MFLGLKLGYTSLSVHTNLHFVWIRFTRIAYIEVRKKSIRIISSTKRTLAKSILFGGGSAFAHKQVRSEHVSLRNSKIYICHVKPRLWSTLTVIMQFIYFVPFPRAIKSTKKKRGKQILRFFFFLFLVNRFSHYLSLCPIHFFPYKKFQEI